MRLQRNYKGAKCQKEGRCLTPELTCRTDYTPPITGLHLPPPVGSLKLSMMEKFTPKKLANPTNQGF